MPPPPVSCPNLLGFMLLRCTPIVGRPEGTDFLGEIRNDPQLLHTGESSPAGPLAISPDLRKWFLGALWSLPFGAHFLCDLD